MEHDLGESLTKGDFERETCVLRNYSPGPIFLIVVLLIEI